MDITNEAPQVGVRSFVGKDTINTRWGLQVNSKEHDEGPNLWGSSDNLNTDKAIPPAALVESAVMTVVVAVVVVVVVGLK